VLTARAPGTWAETPSRVKVKHRKQDDTIVALDLDLIRPDGSIESHKNLGVVASTDRGAAPFVVDALALGSSLVTAVSKSSEWPDEGELRFTGGLDAAVADYEAGLDRLKNHADVDLVIAAVQQRSDTAGLAAVHSAVIAHCNLMSAACRGRLGFGRVPADRPAAKGRAVGRPRWSPTASSWSPPTGSSAPSPA
jgi:hypothetical protein